MSKIIRACALIILLGQFGLMTAQSPPTATQRDAPAAAVRATPVAVGEMAPDFTLKDEAGRVVTLSAARGKMPAVLVFYRGYW